MKHGETLPCGHTVDIQHDNDWPTIEATVTKAVERHQRCPLNRGPAPEGATTGFTLVRPQYDHDTTRTGGTRA